MTDTNNKLKIPSSNADAKNIAGIIFKNINQHYKSFLKITKKAQERFEKADWFGEQADAKKRIALYRTNVTNTLNDLVKVYDLTKLNKKFWIKVKSDYIDLIYEHKQPELAETFYNSIFTKLFHRRYYRNSNIFIRPCISTGFIDNNSPIYKSYYPFESGWVSTTKQILKQIDLKLPYENLRRDIGYILGTLRKNFPANTYIHRNFQLQVISSLFYRNKAAFIVGKAINGTNIYPFVLPIMNNEKGKIYIDTMLLDEKDIINIFSFAWANFMVYTQTPSAIVEFLEQMVPLKSKSDLYNSIGLRRQGKSEFYRGFLYHLNHSSDNFILAPGVKGMVMSVFTMPSYPYVFKVINDYFPPPKETTGEQVKNKYLLVQNHDRVGRMADSLHFLDVAFPVERFDKSVITELKKKIKSKLDIKNNTLFIKELYIERRLYPLDLYLKDATDKQLENIIIDYGNTIKDLIAVNIFPGDLLYKNFGVNYSEKLVFYDYDEVEFISDCRFRKIPQPLYPEQEMAAEPWYAVNENDVFPEEFENFLLNSPRIKKVFMKHHKELIDYRYWQEKQQNIKDKIVADIFPYSKSKRYSR